MSEITRTQYPLNIKQLQDMVCWAVYKDGQPMNSLIGSAQRRVGDTAKWSDGKNMTPEVFAQK